MEIFKMARVQ
uniref:Uncharacterized protein n=1 Tax=Anguilla anguilla TaxID=7936 RepID=A0A0E9SF42_ANGAN